MSETRKGCVSVWDSQWNLASKLGQGEGEFQLPSDIAIDPASRDVFVCDSQATKSKPTVPANAPSFFGGYGSGDGQFNFPAGLCVTKAGEVWVVDQNNDRIQVFNRGGSFLRAFSLGNRTGGSLGGTPSGRSQGIACDDSGRVYVADTYQGFIRVFDQQGTLLSTLGSYGERAGQFAFPNPPGSGFARPTVGGLHQQPPDWNSSASTAISNSLPTPLSAWSPVAAPPAFRLRSQAPAPSPINGAKTGSSSPGATGSILAYAAVTAAQSGLYSVEVSGPAGSLVSPETTLSVQARPKISANPASQGVIAGAAITFDVAATGDALSYQWQRDGLDIPLATNRSWTLAIAQLVDAGLYQVRIANEVDAIVSNPARLSVSIPPPPPQLDSVSLQPDIGVQLLFHCEPGHSYVVETSTDLAEWTPVTTLFCETDSLGFSDANSASDPTAFTGCAGPSKTGVFQLIEWCSRTKPFMIASAMIEMTTIKTETNLPRRIEAREAPAWNRRTRLLDSHVPRWGRRLAAIPRPQGRCHLTRKGPDPRLAGGRAEGGLECSRRRRLRRSRHSRGKRLHTRPGRAPEGRVAGAGPSHGQGDLELQLRCPGRDQP